VPEPAAEAAGHPAPAPTPDLQRQLDAKTREAGELLDQLQRVAAEYSNYQKRMARHLEDEKRLAVRGLVLDLLPALDNFERALAHADQEHNFQVLMDGVKAVHAQMQAALAKHGVRPVEAAGRPFDPEHHEAVTMRPSETCPPGEVLDVAQKGYQLHGQTIRASRVTVSSGPAGPQATEEAGPPPAPGQAKP
jgi:molecular chaperone GrpE